MAGGSKKAEKLEGLHGAARSGDFDALHSIYSSNPTLINARDNHSRTPLHLAAWSGQTKVVQFLCEHKADVRAAAVDNMAAIHFASQKGHLEIVRILLRSGAYVNASTRKGMTALHYAVQGGHVDLVKFLIHKGASLSAETKARKKPIDLAKDDQVRSVLTNSGEFIKGHKESQTDRLHGTSGSNDTGAEPNDESVEIKETSVTGQEVGESMKSGQRGRETEETTPQIGPPRKKAKVALSHLVDDDTQEEQC
uniref:Uncharacterized protein n=1 Tax=Araucaria cunninghamii TaxID=56994 RepID=A0A0D6RAI5_ARACU